MRNQTKELVTAHQTETFFPKGAIAFFLGMILFFGAVWLSLYALMIYRRGSL